MNRNVLHVIEKCNQSLRRFYRGVKFCPETLRKSSDIVFVFIYSAKSRSYLNIEFTIRSQPKAAQLAGHENVMADEKRKRERNFHYSARSIKQLGLLCVKDDAKRHSLKA